MHDYLKAIIANKKKEVAALRSRYLAEHDVAYRGDKSFKKSLQSRGVIAEIKRRSPSKSNIGDIVDPVALAKQYVQGGAVAVSVLTDSYGFGGSIDDLKSVAAALEKNPCPVLRKDFIIDPLQIVEAVRAGANAILLIVAVLKEKTKTLFDLAKQFNIDVLVEVHNVEECRQAVAMGADIIGVNNRDLTTFEVDPDCALCLVAELPADVVKVAESGMLSPQQVKRYFDAGYDAVLVGEALVKAANPARFIAACHYESE